MLPSVRDLTHSGENCYSFVVAIAKKARAIAEKANDENVMLDNTPVKLAIEEYKKHEFIIKPSSRRDNETEAVNADQSDDATKNEENAD